MVNLAMGYHNEHPTMVGDRFVKVDFSDCGPYLSGISLLTFAILAFSDGCEVLKLFKRL